MKRMNEYGTYDRRSAIVGPFHFLYLLVRGSGATILTSIKRKDKFKEF
jgi:hypothetical protein